MEDDMAEWRWFGLSTDLMNVAVWEEDEPSNPDERCVNSPSWFNYKFNDAYCWREMYFFCEVSLF